MSGIKEVIRVLGFIQEYFDNHANEQEPNERKELFVDWSDTVLEVITLLKAQEPRVFSLDELKTLSESGEPVFVETADGECRWALTSPGLEPPDKDGFRYPGGVLFNAIDVNDEIYDGDFYGMKMPDGRPHPLAWRAWSSRSSEELRRNTPW